MQYVRYIAPTVSSLGNSVRYVVCSVSEVVNTKTILCMVQDLFYIVLSA